MSIYVEKFGGYIADNPNIEFERCDGTVFSYDEVNTASMTNNSESLQITGGQGNFPLAILDTTKTLEFTFASSEFTMDMFAMANAAKINKSENHPVLTSKRYEVKADNTIVITDDFVEGSIFIAGMTEAEASSEQGTATPVTGTYTVSNKTITFATGDVEVGDTIRVAYKREVANAEVVTVLTSGTTAKGALTATWPVYSDGDDCTENAVKAYVHVYIPKVRVTALPGFDSSYKTAMTQSITFTALDPKLADGKMFEVIWEDMSETTTAPENPEDP